MCRVHYAVSDTTPHAHVVGSVLIGLSVVHSYRETPGPIPNPEAKPVRADGTATGRLWESKSPPTPNNKENNKIVLLVVPERPPSRLIVGGWCFGDYLVFYPRLYLRRVLCRAGGMRGGVSWFYPLVSGVVGSLMPC